MSDIFRDDMEKPFREQLIELWNGNLFHHREVINYALDGSERHILPALSPSSRAMKKIGPAFRSP